MIFRYSSAFIISERLLRKKRREERNLKRDQICGCFNFSCKTGFVTHVHTHTHAHIHTRARDSFKFLTSALVEPRRCRVKRYLFHESRKAYRSGLRVYYRLTCVNEDTPGSRNETLIRSFVNFSRERGFLALHHIIFSDYINTFI